MSTLKQNFIDTSCVVFAQEHLKYPNFYFSSTSGTPSTSDQGENTTVVMEKETQEQPDALPKRMKADKTQSHTVLSNFHVALDKGTGIVPSSPRSVMSQ